MSCRRERSPARGKALPADGQVLATDGDPQDGAHAYVVLHFCCGFFSARLRGRVAWRGLWPCGVCQHLHVFDDAGGRGGATRGQKERGEAGGGERGGREVGGVAAAAPVSLSRDGGGVVRALTTGTCKHSAQGEDNTYYFGSVARSMVR